MPSGIKVKICGLRRPLDARAAVEAGADMLGVLLCASRRQVSLDEAAEILGEAPETVRKVGIFVDPELEDVEAAVEIAGVEVAQLSGDESPEFCDRLSIETMKSFPSDRGRSRSVPVCIRRTNPPRRRAECAGRRGHRMGLEPRGRTCGQSRCASGRGTRSPKRGACHQGSISLGRRRKQRCRIRWREGY